jgi:ABC-type bacteriocin/lantibiotic exporter with double-glycine peptidase domain
MKYQKHPYSCGAAAVVNALRCFGKNASEMAVRGFSSTTPEKGTDEHGIIAALRGFGFDGESFDIKNFDEAFSEVRSNIEEGYPVILCTWSMQHWVTVIGVFGREPGNGTRFIVADPSNSERNTSENGVKILTKKQLKKSWRSPSGKYYGIACFKK